MERKMKLAVLFVLGLVIAAIMVLPNLFPVGDKEFAVTPNPEDRLAAVIGKGKPVVLEFYAVW